MRIVSPIPSGSGACIIHRMLAKGISGYALREYNPLWTMVPPALACIGRGTPADIVHTTPDYGLFFMRKNTPLVLTFHNIVLDRFMRSYSSFAQRLHYATDLRVFTRQSLYRADTVVCVSRFTANLVREELGYTGTLNVLYNGVDTRTFVPTKKKAGGPVTVLFSGNPVKRKGAHLLPEIAARLNRGVVIQYTSGLRRKTKRFTSPRLQDIGSVPYGRIQNVYRDADILLLPSVREGLSLAVLEAMSCGLPVVTTDCSSMPELIDHGKGGMLCGIDCVEDFAESINMLADSPAKRKEMGMYNRSRVEKHFTLENMIEGYRRLFEKVLG